MRVALGVTYPLFMPTRAPARKKKPVAKKSVKKRVVAKKKSKSIAKRVPKPKIIGKVVHYYDRIGVAIIELATPLVVGDTVIFKRGDDVHTQRISSIQIDHETVQKAKKKDVVGVQVNRVIHEGAFVLPA